MSLPAVPRASTPLELLFDLTFVVAVSQAAASLAHGTEEGHPASAAGSCLMVFFAIWWAWLHQVRDPRDLAAAVLTVLATTGVAALPALGVPLARSLALLTVPVVALVAGTIVREGREERQEW